MAGQIIGARMKALRRQRGLSQDGMARLFGFKDRQIVSAIETGVRRVTATELLLAVEKLNVPLDYFTDPFRLDGEGLFSWRQRDVGKSQLTDYERTASRWIGAYRALGPEVGRRWPLMRRALGLGRQSRLDEALEAGERFAAEYELGDVPARRLAAAMQERLRDTRAHGGRLPGDFGGGVPPAGTGRRAHCPGGSRRTPQFRPGARAVFTC